MKFFLQKILAHEDAVLSLAWSPLVPHVLASGGADQQIILWDLDNGSADTSLKGHEEKIQALAWNQKESGQLLSGGCDKIVNLWDCRFNQVQRHWKKLQGEVEKLFWKDENLFLVIFFLEFLVKFF